MSVQVKLVRAPRCEHPRGKREPIRTNGGKLFAERCLQCQRIIQIRLCAGCRRTFRLTVQSARKGRLYHGEKCRQKAYRSRKRERELCGGEIDGA